MKLKEFGGEQFVDFSLLDGPCLKPLSLAAGGPARQPGSVWLFLTNSLPNKKFVVRNMGELKPRKM